MVFGDLDMGAEEAAVEATGGGLEEGDVRFSGEDELDIAAAPGDALEGAEEAAGREEVGGDDFHRTGVAEVGAELLADGVRAAAGSAGDDLGSVDGGFTVCERAL